MKHSKTVYLYQGLVMKTYLTCAKLNTREKQLLFKLRTRTTPNKSNYKNKYKGDLTCILCKDPNSEENLAHLLNCTYLSNNPQLRDIHTIKCEDIFGCLDDQVKAVKIWAKIFKIYESQKESNQ